MLVYPCYISQAWSGLIKGQNLNISVECLHRGLSPFADARELTNEKLARIRGIN